MANKPDSEARALLDALCEWLTKDVGYMPDYVNRLRDKFDAATASRGMFQRDRQRDSEDR